MTGIRQVGEVPGKSDLMTVRKNIYTFNNITTNNKDAGFVTQISIQFGGELGVLEYYNPNTGINQSEAAYYTSYFISKRYQQAIWRINHCCRTTSVRYA